MKARLVLETGFTLEGEAFGATSVGIGEVVFNTAPFGYQEILTDPSYAGQIVTMAAVQMGNVGTNAVDAESGRPQAVGMVVRTLGNSSNFRAERSLSDYLAAAGVPGISGVDTRKLVLQLRTHGSCRAVLATDGTSEAACLDLARKAPSMEGLDLASKLSTVETYRWSRPSFDVTTGQRRTAKEQRFHVVAVDYGLKHAMLEYLVDEGCAVTVVPASTSATDILALNPDGIFLTNGPGDPAAVVGARETVAALLGKKPIFGICLGHQILALAAGGRTYKMKFGHRGANQPVLDATTGRVEITSQNHGFAVDPASLPAGVRVSHTNLNDGTVEGLELPDARAFSVQHHPEASPGPHDARHLFGRFAELLARG
jgi:carbamoyl-phosphate synthase small subunit